MPEYSEPDAVGNAFGPGTPLVKCWDCGGVLLVAEDRDAHTDWHEEP